MSYKATSPDQAVETRPDPVFGSSSGRLPDEREEGRSRPTSLLRLQSLGLPPEASDSAAPSLGALGAGERRGGRDSDGAPPGGTRVTACLLGGCLGNGPLCLLGPLVGYPRTCGFLSQNLAIRISSQSYSCGACTSSVSPQPPLPPNLQLHRASSSLCPQHLSMHRLKLHPLGCARSISRDLCLYPSWHIRKTPLLLECWDQLLCLADFPGQSTQ